MAEVSSNLHMCGGLFERRHPTAANHVDAAAPSQYPTPLTPLSSRPFVVRSSRRSIQRTESELRHDTYLDKLEVPTLDQISSIAQIQEEKEREIQQRYQNGQRPSQEEAEAAEKIQRTFRGHRARRQMQGLTLDPTTRWIEALKAARYQNITDPQRRRRLSARSDLSGDGERPASASSAGSSRDMLPIDARRSIDARSNWHHLSSIANHAIGEMPGQESPASGSISPRRQSSAPSSKQHLPSSSGDTEHLQVPGQVKHKRKEKPSNPWAGKMMDLPYFLEMIDQKHRYGSNLRAYHEEWMRADTSQPFFWWLDHGEGTEVEVAGVSRKRLEREQVRYLSREERLNYLVRIDDEGRLVWARTGQRITTSTEYRDSLEGIVPVDSKIKGWREDEMKALAEDDDPNQQHHSDNASISSGSPTASPLSSPSLDDAERRYPDPPAMREAKGTAAKATHISAQAIVNRLLRKTLVAQNTWIFTIDTNDNLYVGIKQSGSFQHSSFMRGSRISSAGTIKIKDGQLRALNPLSGHYRPPAKAFRHFVHHLKDVGADMSRVSISKSYAVLVGLEMYMGGRKKMKEAEKKVKRGAGMVIHPAKTKEMKDQEKDNSKSAQKEREIEREEKGTLSRVLEDAKSKVEERWAALDAKRTQDKTAADVQEVPRIPDPDIDHQEGLDKSYKEPDAEADASKLNQEAQAPVREEAEQGQ